VVEFVNEAHSVGVDVDDGAEQRSVVGGGVGDEPGGVKLVGDPDVFDTWLVALQST
jgi:hypothetical protein